MTKQDVTKKLFFSIVLILVAIIVGLIRFLEGGTVFSFDGQMLFVVVTWSVGAILLFIDLAAKAEAVEHPNLIHAETVKSKKIVPPFLKVK